MTNKTLAGRKSSRRLESLREEMYQGTRLTFYQRNRDLIIYGVLHVIFLAVLASFLFYLHTKGIINISFEKQPDKKVRDLSQPDSGR